MERSTRKLGTIVTRGEFRQLPRFYRTQRCPPAYTYFAHISAQAAYPRAIPCAPGVISTSRGADGIPDVEVISSRPRARVLGRAWTCLKVIGVLECSECLKALASTWVVPRCTLLTHFRNDRYESLHRGCSEQWHRLCTPAISFTLHLYNPADLSIRDALPHFIAYALTSTRDAHYG